MRKTKGESNKEVVKVIITSIVIGVILFTLDSGTNLQIGSKEAGLSFGLMGIVLAFFIRLKKQEQKTDFPSHSRLLKLAGGTIFGFILFWVIILNYTK